MTSVPWTDARVDQLTALWLGGLSAAQVAARLGGVTRNAVIGKVHRLGLAGRTLPSAPRRLARSPKAAPSRRPATERPPPGPRALAAEPAARPLQELLPLAHDLASLNGGACRWPIGDPKAAAFGFCGRGPVRGPYCAKHANRAYRPVSPVDRDPFLRHLLAGRVG